MYLQKKNLSKFYISYLVLLVQALLCLRLEDAVWNVHQSQIYISPTSMTTNLIGTSQTSRPQILEDNLRLTLALYSTGVFSNIISPTLK